MNEPTISPDRSSGFSFLRPAISRPSAEAPDPFGAIDRPLPPFSGRDTAFREVQAIAASAAELPGYAAAVEHLPTETPPPAPAAHETPWLESAPAAPAPDPWLTQPATEVTEPWVDDEPGASDPTPWLTEPDEPLEEVASSGSDPTPWLLDPDEPAEGAAPSPADSAPWAVDSPEPLESAAAADANLPSFLHDMDEIGIGDVIPWLELDAVDAVNTTSAAASGLTGTPGRMEESEWGTDDDPPADLGPDAAAELSPLSEVFAVPPSRQQELSRDTGTMSGDSEAARVLEEVASRLERIAQSLRERTPAELLGSSANDPLQMLIAGYALGLSAHARDPD